MMDPSFLPKQKRRLKFSFQTPLTVLSVLFSFDASILSQLFGFLVPYFTEADLKFLKQKITALSFFAERDIKIQLGKHDEFAPAIGASLPFVKRTIEEI